MFSRQETFAVDLALVKTLDYIVGVDVDELIKEKDNKQTKQFAS